ncbi:hypothetical protein F383_35512 [Gossypium arboreum]|uniref:Uncharacterized protein n=1 Tax=Gossypium arboreum TaxID=29729 RepID=A0A0B0MZ28_GOSAR|nr:hypothetical protein F383_34613 [Gossypium arboreum]KHG08434.1 hypothetical protein F383_35512 [Gossypium arboreum]
MIIPLKCSGKYKLYVLEGTVEETLKLQRGKLTEQNMIVSSTFLSRIPAKQDGSIMFLRGQCSGIGEFTSLNSLSSRILNP